ncbi:MAG: SRPBCC domain-containing protein [Bryobacteraceae bacterium]
MKLTDITVTRAIPARAADVFNVWMDASSPGGPWFGAERVILNAAVDGLFYLGVKHQGRTWPHYGRFLRIERPWLVEYTWVSEGTQGIETVVAVTFEALEGQTQVTLHHSGVPDDEMGRRHSEGWTWVLSMLAERFPA